MLIDGSDAANLSGDMVQNFVCYHRTNAELGISPVIADKILNHVTGQIRGVAAIYQHGEYLQERRDALQKWGNFIEKAVTNEK